MSSSEEILIQRVCVLEKQLAILLADKDDSSPVESGPTAKKPKKVADPDKPKKKRTSGYIIYSNAHREEVKEQLTGAEGEKPKNTDIMRKLAENWKQLEDADKETWNAKAKELKEVDSD